MPVMMTMPRSSRPRARRRTRVSFAIPFICIHSYHTLLAEAAIHGLAATVTSCSCIVKDHSTINNSTMQQYATVQQPAAPREKHAMGDLGEKRKYHRQIMMGGCLVMILDGLHLGFVQQSKRIARRPYRTVSTAPCGKTSGIVVPMAIVAIELPRSSVYKVMFTDALDDDRQLPRIQAVRINRRRRDRVIGHGAEPMEV